MRNAGPAIGAGADHLATGDEDLPALADTCPRQTPADVGGSSRAVSWYVRGLPGRGACLLAA
jgi:hypothetical protein